MGFIKEAFWRSFFFFLKIKYHINPIVLHISNYKTKFLSYIPNKSFSKLLFWNNFKYIKSLKGEVLNRHFGHFLIKLHACSEQKVNVFQYIRILCFIRMFYTVTCSVWLDIIMFLRMEKPFFFAFLLLLFIRKLEAFRYAYMLTFFMWVMINKRKQIKINKQLPRLFKALLKINRKILTEPDNMLNGKCQIILLENYW